MDTAVSVELFVEILNRYVYYFDQQNEAVSSPSKCSKYLLIIYRSPQNTSMVSSNSSTQIFKPTKNPPPLRCQSAISNAHWSLFHRESTRVWSRRRQSRCDQSMKSCENWKEGLSPICCTMIFGRRIGDSHKALLCIQCQRSSSEGWSR